MVVVLRELERMPDGPPDRIIHELLCLHEAEAEPHSRKAPEKTGAGNLRVLLNIDGLALPQEASACIAERLRPIAGRIGRMGVLGCAAKNKAKIKREIKKMDIRLYARTLFFDSKSEAVRWLMQC